MKDVEYFWGAYSEALAVLEDVLRTFESKLTKATLVDVSRGKALRFSENDIEHAILMKLAMVLSGMNAALILLRYGHVVEQAALQRLIDEGNEDILFLAIAITNDSPGELHERYLAAFWAEEFADFKNPSDSHQSREQIPRQKIRAYISKFHPHDPSTTNHVLKLVAKAYSGFVHGAAPHLMEIYHPHEHRFRVGGMSGTPRIPQYTRDMWNYVSRTAVSFAVAAKAYGSKSSLDRVQEVLDTLDALKEEFGTRR